MTSDTPDDQFFGDIPSPEVSHQEQGMPARPRIKESLSGNGKRAVDAKRDAVVGKDAQPSRREKIRGIIERLSKPSKIRSIFGPGLTEHAKKYGAPMDLADAMALCRQVDAEYAARKRAGKSRKNTGNRRDSQPSS